MKQYNPKSWFDWREVSSCAVQIVLIVGGLFLLMFLILYILLRG